jgi:cyclopropane-fatty-acyl-phospholipid synthase
MSRLWWPSLPPHLARPVAKGLDVLRSAAGSLTWGPVLSIAKPTVLSIFSQVQIGTLILVDKTQQREHVFGGQNGTLEVRLVVRADAFWVRLLLFADMGFAEAFMLGEVDCDCPTSFFRVSGSGAMACPASAWRS